MILSVQIQQCSQSDDVPADGDLEHWAGTAYSAVGERDAEVTIRVVDLDEGARLNSRFRQRESATNVLSFGYAESAFGPADLLGDIVICAPVVQKEARASAHVLARLD